MGSTVQKVLKKVKLKKSERANEGIEKAVFAGA